MSGAQPAAQKPPVLPLIAEVIPEAMKDIRAWIGWRYAFRNGNWTKEPVDIKSGGFAKTDDPSTWVDFSTALVSWERLGCDGIGWCRTGDYLFVDLDGVLDEAGNIRQFSWASKILSAVVGRAYLEVSVSGTGLHAICRGTLPSGRRQLDVKGLNHTGFAFYDGNRFFTFTGHVWPPEGKI